MNDGLDVIRFRGLRASAAALGHTVAGLADGELTAPSRLPDWSRAHVLAHIAGAAASRRRLLDAARAGQVGRQYASEQSRAAGIERTAAMPARELRAHLLDAVESLLRAIAEYPHGDWDRPGEWLGAGRRPVSGVVPSMRREIEYHHVDLGAGYRPDEWPEDFVAGELPRVLQIMSRRPDVPQIRVVVGDRSWQLGDGRLATVAGKAPQVLAWLTGRAEQSEALQVDPRRCLPPMPPLA
jgi:maleylpyruvate isomerase